MAKAVGNIIAGLIVSFFSVTATAQGDTLRISRDTAFRAPVTDINAPARAAFYSAVLPGLGQAYNGEYWKIPLVYLLIGGSAYLYHINRKEYLRYRRAYQYRLWGLPDEFPEYSTDILITAQNYYRRNRDLSLMVTLLMYALNIIDANVSAHLRQWNINEDLSIRWNLIPGPSFAPGGGIRLTLIKKSRL